jgi:hypothetical protein
MVVRYQQGIFEAVGFHTLERCLKKVDLCVPNVGIGNDARIFKRVAAWTPLCAISAPTPLSSNQSSPHQRSCERDAKCAFFTQLMRESRKPEDSLAERGEFELSGDVLSGQQAI